MSKSRSIFLLLLFVSSLCNGQTEKISARNGITVVFYNIENLFDTSDDPVTADEEFLPSAAKKWDNQKYAKKISDIADVLSSVNERELPVLIGLCETENKKVLEDLAASRKLAKGNYGIVHFDSPDERGIDVALLYGMDELGLVEARNIEVSFGKDSPDRTRDILYAEFRIKGDRVIHLFVNHWPSRSPGQEESEGKRIMAALTLRREVDKILNLENDAAIIIMGDFNDEPTNRSVFQILNASNKLRNAHYRDLYNLMYDSHNNKGEGTILYKDNWQMFDQIIVSQSLLDSRKGYYLPVTAGSVLRNEVVLRKDQQTGNAVISRTYQGNEYAGGISDHLPVYATLRKESR